MLNPRAGRTLWGYMFRKLFKGRDAKNFSIPLSELEEVGEIYFDSGTLLLSDPCYVLHQEALDEVLLKVLKKPYHVEDGKALITEFGGDITAKVYIQRDPETRLVKRVIIDFNIITPAGDTEIDLSQKQYSPKP